jgi:hypothetical protein
MRRVKEYTIIAAFIIAILIIIYLLAIQLDQTSVVTSEEMNNYSQTYINTYKNLVGKYIHSDNQTYLKFYNENPYHVRAVISTTHGAGLEFVPARMSSFEIKQTNEQIEEYIFNGSANQPLFVITGTNISFSDLSIESHGSPFKILENGSLSIWNLGINGKYYNTTIIKGSNRKRDWTTKIASEEASIRFKNDLIGVFTVSEEFRRYLAMPVLSNVANGILEKNNKGYYKDNYLLYVSDYEELYNVAKEYGVNGQFADDIYNFNENQKDPSWWEQYDESGLYRNLLGGLLVLIIIALGGRIKKIIYKLMSRK